MENKTILLKVELDTADLKKNAVDAEAQLKKLVPALEKIKKEQGINTLEYKKAQAEIRAYNKILTDSAKALQINEKIQQNNSGSINDMRAQLSASTVAYNNLTKEQRENTDVGQKLQAEIRDISDALKSQESAIGDNRRNVGNYGTSLAEMRKELKALKSEMVGLDAGSQAYQEASIKAGKLGDKIKEVNENVKASSGGTGFEKMSNNLGLIRNDLQNLDFDGVSEKMKQMALISKTMTFSEAAGGLKSMGSALLNLGKAIITNPLFLMVGAIVAIVGALKMWNDSVEEEAIKAQEDHLNSINSTIAGLESMKSKMGELNDLYLENAKLQGKSEKEIAKERLKNLEEDHKADLELRKRHENKVGVLYNRMNKARGTEDEKQKTDEYLAEVEALNDINFLVDTYGIRRENLILENNKNIETETKNHNEKIKALNEKKYSDALAIERRLNDLILEGKQLSYEQEKQQLDAKYLFLSEASKNNAKELLDIEEMKNIEFQKINNDHRQLEIDAVTEDYKRQIEDAKTNKTERELTY